MSVAPTPQPSPPRKGVLIHDDRGHEVALFKGPGRKESKTEYGLTAEKKLRLAEPEATESWLRATPLDRSISLYFSLIVLFSLSFRFLWGKYLPSQIFEALKLFASPGGWVLVFSVAGFILYRTARRRHRARVRAAYLAAGLCPSCARALTSTPDADGCTICSAPDCRAAWKLPQGASAFTLAHPLHCPECNYDRAGVAPFTPCPECAFTLKEEELFLARPTYPTGAGPDALHKNAIPPPGLLGINLERFHRGQCPYCGYNRKGISPAARCPECASTIARRAPRLDDPPPPGTRPICVRCRGDMQGREQGRICPDCGIMAGISWIPVETR